MTRPQVLLDASPTLKWRLEWFKRNSCEVHLCFPQCGVASWALFHTIWRKNNGMIVSSISINVGVRFMVALIVAYDCGSTAFFRCEFRSKASPVWLQFGFRLRFEQNHGCFLFHFTWIVEIMYHQRGGDKNQRCLWGFVFGFNWELVWFFLNRFVTVFGVWCENGIGL